MCQHNLGHGDACAGEVELLAGGHLRDHSVSNQQAVLAGELGVVLALEVNVARLPCHAYLRIVYRRIFGADRNIDTIAFGNLSDERRHVTKR